MRLKSIELSGFKSFARKTTLEFGASVTAVVGPNGSGKSNVAESFRFVLGEQSMKSMRGKRGEDLIWNGSQATPRAGRASVKLIFDNSDRALNLDFDEVTLERVVHRDGGNDYLLNGSIVRLRDIAELLSQANIGASGHHIISQGEADRVLSASVRERREMLEDALGLTAYLYKREEAEKKLLKTAENMHEVEALRRELTPHLKFLTAQVKKIEESQQLRDNLVEMYQDYLKRESVYLRSAKAALVSERSEPEREHGRLEASIAHLREEIQHAHGKDKGTKELITLEEEGRAARAKRDTLSRELGRVEGELRAQERIAAQVQSSVPASQAREFAEHIQEDLKEILNLDASVMKSRLSALIIYATEFVRRITTSSTTSQTSKDELVHTKATIERDLHELEREEVRITNALAQMRQKLDSEKDASREAERELFATMAKRSELEVTLAALRGKEDLLNREEEEFKRTAGEAAMLLGQAVADFESHQLASDAQHEPRSAQADRLRRLQRLTIKLEESGAGNAHEIMKEFNETSEREQFLARELQDLEASAAKLRELIVELTKTLQLRFDEGINKINKEFDAFFKLMFGGGTASLTLVKEAKLRRGVEVEDLEVTEIENDTEVEEGVDIAVSLPHKRIKGLHMLSGGERALTSIALIFAMSQVNPPPFLILDETEAALDEANSRRYGDMIETLAKHSQLIVITHNRETMSRAGVLYGITMGQDGVSKLLSVKFEEAVVVAK